MKTSLASILLVILAIYGVTAAPYPDPDPVPDPDPQTLNSAEYDDSSDSDDDDDHDSVRKKRQLSGGFNVGHTPFGKNYQANLGYHRNFNKGRTSLGVNAFRNWGAGGRSHGAGISFTHKFG